jgi:hypothetical protein
MQFNKSLLDSSSKLRKFKLSNGLNPTGSATASSYILINKIKRIIRSEVRNIETYDNEIKAHFFTQRTEITKEVFIDRIISRLEIFTDNMLSYCLHVYDMDGLIEFLRHLRMPLARLKKDADRHFAAINKKQNRLDGEFDGFIEEMP